MKINRFPWRHFITAVVLLALPAVVQAQFTYITNYTTATGYSIAITGYNGPGGMVVIPNVISGYAVTSIGNGAFSQCIGLTGIAISDSVTSIGSDAFYRCGSLTNVTIPARVTEIGEEAFSQCTNLTSVIISNAQPYLAVSIGTSAFMGCSGLTSVFLGNFVTNIGDLAFANCTALNAIYYGGSPPPYDGTPFNGDPNVAIYYPPGTTDWGATYDGVPAVAQTPMYDFSYSASNGSGTITRYLGPGAAVIIPPFINGYPVTSIGNGSFAQGPYIPTSVTIPNTVTNIGINAFQDAFNLTNVTIPDSVTTIGMSAFSGSSLTAITIPTSVTTIGQVAFYGCPNLTTVTIAGSATSIGPYAFAFCSSLTSAWFPGNAPPAGTNVFSGDSSAIVYYLPGTSGWTNTFRRAPTALWYQPQPTVLAFETSFGVQNNQFGFTISWATNASVIVQASTNLANPTWIPVATNVLNNGTNYFSDPQWTNYPDRFYRVGAP